MSGRMSATAAMKKGLRDSISSGNRGVPCHLLVASRGRAVDCKRSFKTSKVCTIFAFPMKEYAPLTDVESVLSMLSKISFLGGVSEAERECIFRRLEVGIFESGEYVSKKGDVPSHIYIIKKGKIDLLLTGESETIKKREFKAGECFGEAALLSMINNTASFVAAEDSEVIVLSRRALNQLRGEDPKVFCVLILNLARELARKLQFTDEMLLKDDQFNGEMIGLSERRF